MSTISSKSATQIPATNSEWPLYRPEDDERLKCADSMLGAAVCSCCGTLRGLCVARCDYIKKSQSHMTLEHYLLIKMPDVAIEKIGPSTKGSQLNKSV